MRREGLEPERPLWRWRLISHIEGGGSVAILTADHAVVAPARRSASAHCSEPIVLAVHADHEETGLLRQLTDGVGVMEFVNILADASDEAARPVAPRRRKAAHSSLALRAKAFVSGAVDAILGPVIRPPTPGLIAPAAWQGSCCNVNPDRPLTSAPYPVSCRSCRQIRPVDSRP